MQKGNIKLAAIAAVVIVVVLLASWQLFPGEKEPSEVFADAMIDGDYGDCYEMLSEEAREVYEPLGYPAFEAQMDSLKESMEAVVGPCTGKGDTRAVSDCVTETVLLCQYGGMRVSVVTDAEGMVMSFFLFNHDLPSKDQVPESIVEEEVSFGPDGLSELPGRISYAEGSDHSRIAVLVQGSGPHGMNMAMGDNQIFQQIAWGLNEQGIDVLRYDKRTYADPYTSMALGNALTIDYETVDDAVAAAHFLDGRGYEGIYVIGHSLGAMMAPAILEESDGLYDGMVSLAGSPRPLAEISYDQNMMYIDQLPDGPNKDALVAFVNDQLALYRTIGTMSQEELLGTTIFGMSAFYLRSIDMKDTVAAAEGLDVPMLFLQGTSDWQVSAEKDFGAWSEILDGRENVEMVLMAGLNHIFAIPGEHAGTVMEYYQPQTVNPSVIDAIADFINTH